MFPAEILYFNFEVGIYVHIYIYIYKASTILRVLKAWMSLGNTSQEMSLKEGPFLWVAKNCVVFLLGSIAK